MNEFLNYANFWDWCIIIIGPLVVVLLLLLNRIEERRKNNLRIVTAKEAAKERAERERIKQLIMCGKYWAV